MKRTKLLALLLLYYYNNINIFLVVWQTYAQTNNLGSTEVALKVKLYTMRIVSFLYVSSRCDADTMLWFSSLSSSLSHSTLIFFALVVFGCFRSIIFFSFILLVFACILLSSFRYIVVSYLSVFLQYSRS